MDRLDLYLVRHAPAIHPEGFVPPHDPEADITDNAAFTDLARALPRQAVWWVSPLKRCRMTAEKLLAGGVGAAEVISDERLVEQNLGRFHGRPIAEVWDELKDRPKSNWHFLHHSFRPPGGESFVMLHERMAPVLSAIEATETGSLILVGHAMATKSLIAHAFGLTMEQALAFAVSPLSLSRMTFIRDGNGIDQGSGGQWQIDWLNRTYLT